MSKWVIQLILDIYVLWAFQWYKELLKPFSFWPPIIALWRFGSLPGLHLPKWELPWECEGSFLHTFLHSPEHAVCLLGFLLAYNLASSFALVANPRLGSRHSLSDCSTLTLWPISFPPMPYIVWISQMLFLWPSKDRHEFLLKNRQWMWETIALHHAR
jgi:hypothetical protein